MCSRSIARQLAMSMPFLVVAAVAADAASVRYSWSGRVEPLAGEANPWGLTGDGSAVTSSDGTPFLIEAFVDEAALDEDGTLNPDFAEFAAAEATLIIGDRRAILDRPTVTFSDDAFAGLFDSIGFAAEVDLLGTTLSFAAEARLPATSFDLASPGAPDPPPVFGETPPIQFGGSVRSILVTMPANEPVRADPVPWAAFPPASAVEWVDETLGFAGDIEVTIAGLGEPRVVFYDLSIPGFTAAPFFSLTPALDYETGSTWTVTFSEPVATLLLYTRFWRGNQGGADPVTYHFDVPFSIRSGLEQASVLGNLGGMILSLPGSGFHDGVVQIPGPLTNLTVTPNTSTGSQQAMSMAVVPLPQARPVDWSTPSSGSAGAIDVTLADLASPALASGDLSGADFATAALSASEDVLDYDVGSDWTATLSESAPGLLLYARSWRGTSAGVGPVTYRFDTPFTILSGLRDAAVAEDGTLLTLPADGFHDGILFFPGPLGSLSVDANGTASSAQQMTLAVVPEAGATAGGMAVLAVLMTLCRRRSRGRASMAGGGSTRGPLLLVLAAFAAVPAQAVEIEFVPVAHPGNPCDPQPAGGCFGGVEYAFEISRYEITNAQYVEFLNAVANETDLAALYHVGMAGIDFPLVPIGFERFYEVVPGFANQPVDHVSIADAFRFANWLHHGKPSGAAGVAAIEDGAYTMLITRLATQRNPGATVFVPSRDEWYKAAYYDPASGYSEYPNGTDTPIVCATPLAASGGANCESAVGGTTDVRAYPDSMSPFGTFDQGGNVSEWTETTVNSDTREVRGGNWFTTASALAAATASSVDADFENIGFGFRVARAAPEPGAGALGGASALALLVASRARSRRLASCSARGADR